MKLIIIICTLFGLSQWMTVPSEGANVLVLLPFSPRSQKIAFDVLVQELSERNHSITYITMFKPAKELRGVTTILMDPRMIEYFENTTQKMFNTSVSFSLTAIPTIGKLIYDLCDLILQDPNLVKFMKTSDIKYDVTLTNSMIHECYLPIAHKVGVPVVLLSVPVLFPSLAWALNIPFPLSYLPMMIMPYNSTMTFGQRLFNFVGASLWHVIYNYVVAPYAESAVKTHIPDAVTTIEIVQNASLLLVNSHSSFEGPRPSTPNMVEVGCLHCHQGKQLPKELETFVEESGEDGFIVFSLGSIIKGHYMPPKFDQTVVEAFAKIKQRVVWKYEGKLVGLTPNVLTKSWIPQQDLMAHPRCKMAITHGGILSLQEVAYHGVPLLGVPLGVDRIKNINTAMTMGFALSLDDWDNLTAASLVGKINELVYNPKYRQNAEKLSDLMKDRPEHPLKTAAYWIEYIIRHKGAPHLRNSVQHLNVLQYFLIDVIAVLIFTPLLIMFILYKLTKLVFRYLFRKDKPSKTKLKKR